MTGPDRPSGAGTFWLAVVDAGSSLADSRAAGGSPIAAIRSKFVVSHPAFLPGIRTLASRNTTSRSRAREEGATVRLRAASPWWRCRDSDLLEDYGDSVYYPGRKITLGERFKALTHRRVTKAAAR